MRIESGELVAITALSGVIVSAVISGSISYISSRRSIYITAVTTERMKWINEIRGMITSFQSGFFHYVAKDISSLPKEPTDFLVETRDLLALENQLIIHLSGRGKIEDNVVAIARSYSSAAFNIVKDKKDADKRRIFGSYGDLLALHANFLFKKEWEKVKIEASGILLRLILRRRTKRLMFRYREFCKHDGYFVSVEQAENFFLANKPRERTYTFG